MNDPQILVALELLRRQLVGIPLAMIQAWQQYQNPEGGENTVAPSLGPTSDAEAVRNLTQWDVNAANRANQRAADGWPKLIILLNAALNSLASRSGALGEAKSPLALPAAKTRARKEAKKQEGFFARAWKRIKSGFTAAKNRVKKAFSPAGRRDAGRRLGSILGKSAKAGGKAVAGAVAGAMGGGPAAMIVKLLTSILGTIGPMAVLAATIQSATSGFKVMTSAVNILGASLGPILFPIFFHLAVHMTRLAYYIMDAVTATGELEGYFKTVGAVMMATSDGVILGFETLHQATSRLVEAFVAVWNWVQNRVNDTSTAGNAAVAAVSPVGALAKMAINAVTGAGKAAPAQAEDTGAEDFSGDTGAGGSFDQPGRAPRPGPGGSSEAPAAVAAAREPSQLPRPGAEAFRGKIAPEELGEQARGQLAAKFLGGAPLLPYTSPKKPGDIPGSTTGSTFDSRRADSLRDVLTEVKNSFGQRAQIYSNASQAAKSAQMSALNESPFEKKIQAMMQQMINAQERVAKNTQQNAEPRYGKS